MLLLYLGLQDVWTSGNNFRVYGGILFIVFLILGVLGAFMVFRRGPEILKVEAKGFIPFAIGSFLLFLIPVGSGIGMLPGGSDFLGPIHIIILILGIIICLAGMVMLARDGEFFTAWFPGAGFILIFGGHNALGFFSATAFGSMDAFLVGEALGLLIASFLLYAYYELKFIYLAYLVDEALEFNEAKAYEKAVELLDKALLIYPQYKTALNNKGNVLYRMKEYNLARECYLRVVDVDPYYGKAKSNLKLANKKLGIKEAV